MGAFSFSLFLRPFYPRPRLGPRPSRNRIRRSSVRRSTCSNIAVNAPISATTNPPTVRNSDVIFHSVPLAGKAGCSFPEVIAIRKDSAANSSSTPARM